MMVDTTKRVELSDVEVLNPSGLVLRCRVGHRIFGIPPLQMLPGTEIQRSGDRGRLVLPLNVAEELGLVPPPRY
jgi:hypothetical protein